MNYTLKNDILTVTLCDHGAEIISVKRGDCEYIWQADPTYWTGKAPLLFPVCGRLFGFKYTYEGKTYDLGNHGFARRMDYDVVSVSDNSITFALDANNETRACYPFEFRLTVSYTLEGDKISSHVEIKNTGDKTLPATFGCHPGFNVPLSGGSFDDYYLEFSKDCTPNELIFTPTCFNTGKKKVYPLVEGRKLPLRHSLFDVDAVFMDRIADTVTLKSDKSERYVTYKYAGFPYLGIWHKPQSDAPYVCIEPWCGLPSYDGVTDDIMERSDMYHILAGRKQDFNYELIFG
jgi:galactose mutarotase-like enzyme